VPHTARKRVAEEGLPFRDGIHGAGHALVNVLPLFLMCAASDMATECDNPYDTRYRPERLLLYDTHPGGIGLAWQARPFAAQPPYLMFITRVYTLAAEKSSLSFAATISRTIFCVLGRGVPHRGGSVAQDHGGPQLAVGGDFD